MNAEIRSMAQSRGELLFREAFEESNKKIRDRFSLLYRQELDIFQCRLETHVRLQDVVSVPKRFVSSEVYSFSLKGHADFVLFWRFFNSGDTDLWQHEGWSDWKPKEVFELDGPQHRGADQTQNDEMKNLIFILAGLPIRRLESLSDRNFYLKFWQKELWSSIKILLLYKYRLRLINGKESRTDRIPRKTSNDQYLLECELAYREKWLELTQELFMNHDATEIYRFMNEINRYPQLKLFEQREVL